MKDPIIEQVHDIRRQRAAKFKHDIDAMFADLRKQEEAARRQGAKFVTPRKRKKAKVG
jgi:hypothetical protein